jgi:peptidyl-dipeptidase A
MSLTNYSRGLVACAVAAILATTLVACGKPAEKAAAAPKLSADEFVAELNRELDSVNREAAAAGWVQSTYITTDTEYLASRVTERYLEFYNRKVTEAKAYEGQKLSPATARALEQLKLGLSAPAPADPAKRKELAELGTSLESMYGTAKYCPPGQPDTECLNIDKLSEVIAKSRDYDTLTQAWTRWHDIARPMRPKYQRFAELANEGARELGFADVGVLWRAGYDMPAEEFATEADRLWNQVKPLYDGLHCYARGRLAAKYGADKVPAGKPIPVQLLGNMWGQQWNKIYDDLLKPYPKASIETADRALVQQKWDATRMFKSAESFYTSLGFPTLPPTFWERSMITRPRDREVVCHASAWSMDGKEDVRIKMCTQPNEEDLFTIYHELGHIYYDLAYNQQPLIFQGGAHDGFHEAIGDTVNLSVTPGYLNRIGLVSAVKPSQDALINEQMKMALDKIAFLPFGKLIDQWRWGVFNGTIKPEDYNKAWWELRRKYQGVVPAVERSEADFDPGAKYHIPGNTSYTRYFLSFVMQFQFHKALCEAAGHKGPLHECSVFGNKEAGAKYIAMLSRGASQPWQDTLQELTGGRTMDGSAIIDYFAPLKTWLDEQNKNQTCGWD